MIDHITPEQLRAAADGPHRGTQAGDLLRRAATAIEYQVAEHDHRADPKVWCTRCQHEHIASVPATTYECDSCGFAQWDLGTARLHEAQQDGHRAYPIAHPTVPLDERPAQPSVAGVLHEVVTRIDEARYANGDGGSPWDNTDVLGLLAHLRQPYTEGGATAEVECGSRHPHFPAVTSTCTQPLGHDGPHVSIDDYVQWPEEGTG